MSATSSKDHRRRVELLLGDYRHAYRVVEEERERLEKAKECLVDALRAQEIVQAVAQEVQDQAHRRIAVVVTRCLKAVFEEDAYAFQIRFDKKRGKTEAVLQFVREGREIDPTTAAGGGVVDCAAFALRMACLLLSHPSKRRVLILDEPWKHLSAGYRPAMRELVKTLAQEMKVQFIIVTHSRAFRIGKVVEIEK